jgi:SOCE-associated regulatory factor of calcium homoeostasis
VDVSVKEPSRPSWLSFSNLWNTTVTILRILLEYPVWSILFLFFMYNVVKWALSRLISSFRPSPTQQHYQQPPRRAPSNFFGHGGGGGGTDPYDGPPPPYYQYHRKTYQVTPETQEWRPGFWTGFTTGSAAGYVFGSRNPSHSTPTQPSYSDTTFSSSGHGSGNEYSQNVHASTGFGGTRRR